jgi:hypothetical protein
MSDITPIKITQTISIIQGWACDKCDEKYEDEKAARNHRASHSYIDTRWIGGTSLYLFETEYEFAYWKQYGGYAHSGGCSGPWEGAGWYLIDWKGSTDNEYPSLELAGKTLQLRLDNTKYEYEKAQENIKLFQALAS